MMQAIKNLFKKEVKAPAPLRLSAGRPLNLPLSNHYVSTLFTTLSLEYNYLWPLAVVIPNSLAQADRAVHTALKNKNTYLDIEAKTKVPWFFTAALHMRESNFDFTKHLHNGDPLSERTTHVPTNRPALGSPPFTFTDSAIDALQYEGFASEEKWDVATTFYCLEAWNGHGYRRASNECTPVNASPYVYSGTQFYECGKFVADHKFDTSLRDGQLGVMAFLKHLSEVETIFP